MAANPPSGYVDLYQRLQQLRASQGAPIYRSKDSHWAPLAAGMYAQELADAARPGLWQPQDLVPTGPQRDSATSPASPGSPATTPSTATQPAERV